MRGIKKVRIITYFLLIVTSTQCEPVGIWSGEFGGLEIGMSFLADSSLHSLPWSSVSKWHQLKWDCVMRTSWSYLNNWETVITSETLCTKLIVYFFFSFHEAFGMVTDEDCYKWNDVRIWMKIVLKLHFKYFFSFSNIFTVLYQWWGKGRTRIGLWMSATPHRFCLGRYLTLRNWFDLFILLGSGPFSL